jgi:hypothetical protein
MLAVRGPDVQRLVERCQVGPSFFLTYYIDRSLTVKFSWRKTTDQPNDGERVCELPAAARGRWVAGDGAPKPFVSTHHASAIRKRLSLLNQPLRP